jgi:hypothetical protein
MRAPEKIFPGNRLLPGVHYTAALYRLHRHVHAISAAPYHSSYEIKLNLLTGASYFFDGRCMQGIYWCCFKVDVTDIEPASNDLITCDLATEITSKEIVRLRLRLFP